MCQLWDQVAWCKRAKETTETAEKGGPKERKNVVGCRQEKFWQVRRLERQVCPEMRTVCADQGHAADVSASGVMQGGMSQKI